MKWDMGWMHDTLEYMSQEPVHRSYHHNKLTFRMIYAFHENYVLPLSHDEVVHGKGSLLGKMPGDEWQKFANLRLLLGYMFAQPGKKLLFMGAEFGQWQEWTHDRSLDWHLLEYGSHRGLQRWMEDLNQFYRKNPAMHARDFLHEGFAWIDCNDVPQSTISLLRHGSSPDDDTWWSATLHRCRGTTTGSGCRGKASGTNASTAMPANMAAATRATWAPRSRTGPLPRFAISVESTGAAAGNRFLYLTIDEGGPGNVLLLTNEYPPNIYGGAGVHVSILAGNWFDWKSGGMTCR